MVASLQETSQEEECFTQALQHHQHHQQQHTESRNTADALPLSHEAAKKWFYKDPQGEIQGTGPAWCSLTHGCPQPMTYGGP